MAISVDRLQGLSGDLGVKCPVRVATTANITLSGLQTIDGITVVAGDRVLVKDQTDAADNGIWDAATSSWSRSLDFDGANDAVAGTMVIVSEGANNAGAAFRVSNTGSISIGTTLLSFIAHSLGSLAASAGSSLIGFIQAGVGAVLRTLQDKCRERVSVIDFGAVADGVDTGSAFTGTDNTAAFQSALDFCGSTKKRLHIPAGKYYFAKLAADAQSLRLSYDDYVISGDGFAVTELLIDEDTTLGAGVEDFIRGSNLGTSSSRTLRGTIEMYGFAFRGRWSHSPAQNAGTHFFTVQNFREVNIHDLAAYDCRGKFSRSSILDTVRVNNCVFERISSDCLRFTDANDVSIHNNTFKYIDDDVIALHTEDNASYPPRERISVVGNNFFQCESVLLLGARNTVVTGNTFKFSKSSALYVGGVVAAEGDTNSHSIIVSDNSVVDTLMRYDAATNVFLTQSAINSAIIVASQGLSLATTSSAYPGYPTTAGTSFVDPLGVDSNSAMLMNNYTSASNSIPAGMNIIINNNSVLRTLPAVANFSDYGFGTWFSGDDGWVDPSVALTQTVTNGISLIADMKNVCVSGNAVSGYRNGAGVYLRASSDSPDYENTFNNVLIHSNAISDCMFGVTHSLTAASSSRLFSWSVKVVNNIIDCDPYHQSSARTSPIDGTWQAGISVGSRPSGVYHRQADGWIILHNSFANCYDAILGNESEKSSISKDNVILCDPAVVGFSASNKGVGDIGYGGEKYIHQIMECDPRTPNTKTVTLTRSGFVVTATSVAHGFTAGQGVIITGANETGYLGQWIIETVPTADTFTFVITGIPTTPATGTITASRTPYGEHIYSPVLQSTAVPTVGKFVTGHFIRNSTPTTASSKTTIGWVRQTIGVTHSVATTTTSDWAPVVATTS